MSTRYVPIEQVPVVEFKSRNPPGWRGSGNSTGIRCPKCRANEIVYNGNYFCSGYGEDCSWALPHKAEADPDGYEVPQRYRDLFDALVSSQERPSS